MTTGATTSDRQKRIANTTKWRGALIGEANYARPKRELKIFYEATHTYHHCIPNGAGPGQQ
jgi:hypothetical protein